MADDLAVTNRLVIPATELTERFSRSSGPGGQGVNTTDSRVELVFDLAGSPSIPDFMKDRMLARLNHRLVNGVITVAASEFRSQFRNREAARMRLAALLRSGAAPPPASRRPTKPSRGAKERRLAEKTRRANVKRDRRRPIDE
jgi:ribosome-associated protein